MQSVSVLYRTILADTHYFETRLDIDDVGTFGEDALFSIKTGLEMFHDTPEIGTAVAGEITISMEKPAAEVPIMATLRPYVRAVGKVPTQGQTELINDILYSYNAEITDDIIVYDDDDLQYISDDDILTFLAVAYEDAVSEWLPQGVFFIDTRQVTKNDNGLDVLTIHGYDAMLKAEQDYIDDGSLDWSSGTVSDAQMVAYIARAMNVTVDARTYPIMNKGYRIPLPAAYSMREVLGYIAGMYVGCFVITDVGQLRLIGLTDLPAETNYLADNIGYVITFGGDRILV